MFFQNPSFTSADLRAKQMLEVKIGNVVQTVRNWNLRRGTLKIEANKPEWLAYI